MRYKDYTTYVILGINKSGDFYLNTSNEKNFYKVTRFSINILKVWESKDEKLELIYENNESLKYLKFSKNLNVIVNKIRNKYYFHTTSNQFSKNEDIKYFLEWTKDPVVAIYKFCPENIIGENIFIYKNININDIFKKSSQNLKYQSIKNFLNIINSEWMNNNNFNDAKVNELEEKVKNYIYKIDNLNEKGEPIC